MPCTNPPSTCTEKTWWHSGVLQRWGHIPRPFLRPRNRTHVWCVLLPASLVCHRSPPRPPPAPMHACPLHLPNVDGRVDRVAHVHHNVGAAQLEITGQHVELDLGHCRGGTHAWEV